MPSKPASRRSWSNHERTPSETRCASCRAPFEPYELVDDSGRCLHCHEIAMDVWSGAIFSGFPRPPLPLPTTIILVRSPAREELHVAALARVRSRRRKRTPS